MHRDTPQADTGETEEPVTATSAEIGADEVLAEDLLVEEVSIDGMCGVY